MKCFLLAGLLITQLSFSQTSKNNVEVLLPYVTFIEKQNVSAKDYILSLFERYDLVILCERDHRDLVQYELITDIIRDERFVKNVGNVYCEVGSSSLNPALNNFLHQPGLSDQEVKNKVMTFHRNATPFLFWEKYSYTYFLTSLYNFNKNLTNNKINLYPVDLPMDWTSATAESIKTMHQQVKKRDSIMAAQFITVYNNKNNTASKNKGLIIMNYRHAFMVHNRGAMNFGAYVSAQYPGKVANVYINFAKIDEMGKEYTPLQDGKWDAAFKKSAKDNIGFNFTGSPFGNDSVDFVKFNHKMTFSELFNGFVYYHPIQEWKLSWGVNGIMDDTFMNEYIKRTRLFLLEFNNKDLSNVDDITLKKEFQNKYNQQITTPVPNLEKIQSNIDKWLY